MKPTAIVGSSNLTKRGLGLNDESTNLELCYRLPIDKYSEAYNYAKKIMINLPDYKTYQLRKGI